MEKLETGAQYKIDIISLPGKDSFREGLCFAGIYLSFSPRVISELRGPIAAKFCTMLDAAV